MKKFSSLFLTLNEVLRELPDSSDYCILSCMWAEKR